RDQGVRGQPPHRGPRSRGHAQHHSRGGLAQGEGGGEVMEDAGFRRYFLRGPLRAALCDADLRVRAASNELADACRAAAAELIGRPLFDVLPPAPGEEPHRGPAQIGWVALLPSGERLRVTALRDGELVHAVAERLEGAATAAPLVAFGRELVSLYREDD